jgi:hypothetical protein
MDASVVLRMRCKIKLFNEAFAGDNKSAPFFCLDAKEQQISADVPLFKAISFTDKRGNAPSQQNK